MLTNRALPLITALLLVSAGLAGCIGDDPAPNASPTTTSPTEPENGSPAGAAAFPGTASTTVLWRNGSFGAEENQLTGQPTGSWLHSIDLTEEIPAGNLVRLNATLDYEQDDTDRVFDNLEVQLDAPEEAVLQSRNTDGTIPQYLTAAIQAEDGHSVGLVLEHQWPTASAESQYTLRIQISVTPATVPAGVPTEIAAPEDVEALEIRPADEDRELSAMAWGPDEGYLGWRSSDEGSAVRIPLAEAGPHTVRTDAPAHLQLVDDEGTAVAPTEPLEPRSVTTTLGEAHTLETGRGPETWTTEVPQAPIGVSFQVLPAGPADSGALAGQDVRVMVTTENGTVMDEPFFFPVNAFAADGPVFLDGLTGFPRSFADRNTTGGEWTWAVEYDLAHEVQIVPVWVHHGEEW